MKRLFLLILAAAMMFGFTLGCQPADEPPERPAEQREQNGYSPETEDQEFEQREGQQQQN
jgi:hypothetical protein